MYDDQVIIARMGRNSILRMRAPLEATTILLSGSPWKIVSAVHPENIAMEPLTLPPMAAVIMVTIVSADQVALLRRLVILVVFAPLGLTALLECHNLLPAYRVSIALITQATLPVIVTRGIIVFKEVTRLDPAASRTCMDLWETYVLKDSTVSQVMFPFFAFEISDDEVFL